VTGAGEWLPPELHPGWLRRSLRSEPARVPALLFAQDESPEQSFLRAHVLAGWSFHSDSGRIFAPGLARGAHALAPLVARGVASALDLPVRGERQGRSIDREASSAPSFDAALRCVLAVRESMRERSRHPRAIVEAARTRVGRAQLSLRLGLYGLGLVHAPDSRPDRGLGLALPPAVAELFVRLAEFPATDDRAEPWVEALRHALEPLADADER